MTTVTTRPAGRRCIPAVHVPCAAPRLFAATPQPPPPPPGVPNPSRFEGRFLPCPHRRRRRRGGGEGEEGEELEVVHGDTVKTGATGGTSWTHHRRHVVVCFLLADEPCRLSSLTPALRPVATKVRTSFPCPLWTPRPSSRGGTLCSHRATAQPRHRCW
jgi:hypothetical protein